MVVRLSWSGIAVLDANEEEKSVLLDFFPCHCVKKYVARVRMRMRVSFLRCICAAVCAAHARRVCVHVRALQRR